MYQSLPFGGVKHSGFGRFGGAEGLRACCLVKAVVEDRWWPYKIPKPIQHYMVSAYGMGPFESIELIDEKIKGYKAAKAHTQNTICTQTIFSKKLEKLDRAIGKNEAYEKVRVSSSSSAVLLPPPPPLPSMSSDEDYDDDEDEDDTEDYS
ncbi:hypothetical protein Ahy_A10g048880 isoform A [Arachis hypogaea]|uniref:Aldehyde dehydrogenase domain-containing protein n=1 Tax=Arachis hypogaea TaxID=3818 RepID=A0A445B647_ARAHY|nr:hypothetical protein Ahy_A10g048880 isoform A [Arachis hypogaea]